jgi:hypothetical protein
VAGKAIDPSIYDGIDEFATVRQLEYLAAVRDKKSVYGAGKVCGVHPNVVRNSLELLLRKAAKHRLAPHREQTAKVPEGFAIKGTTTLYDEGGKTRLQWVKTTADDEAREEALKQFAETLAQSVHPLQPLANPPQNCLDDLLCVYPMGDPHFGMYAWAKDAGDNFDLAIAERLTLGAVDRLVATAPSAATALLLNLGDMFHADNQKNQTQSGHQLDVDGRWAKVQQVGMMAKVHCIKRLREKHTRVVVRINPGNHDRQSAYTLALMLSCWFRDDPQVTIELEPGFFWYFQFGAVLLGSTHGDTAKGKDLMSIMASDRPQEWGLSKHRYFYVGHVHHHDSKEYHGGIVEYFRTLASRDAWHHGQGYRAGRDMQCIVHHKEHGEIERHRCDVGMVQ